MAHKTYSYLKGFSICLFIILNNEEDFPEDKPYNNDGSQNGDGVLHGDNKGNGWGTDYYSGKFNGDGRFGSLYFNL